MGALKEQLGFLLRAVDDGGVSRKRLLRLGDAEGILAGAEAALAPLTAEQLDLDAEGSLELERVPQL